MRYPHITTLNDCEVIFLDYLHKKMLKQKRDYVNTNYGYIKNIAGYKNIPGARYLVKNLANKKLITVQEGTNYKGRQFLRIKIAKPRVVKKLLEEYSTQISTKTKEAPLTKENKQKATNTTLPLNNINIIRL